MPRVCWVKTTTIPQFFMENDMSMRKLWERIMLVSKNIPPFHKYASIEFSGSFHTYTKRYITGKLWLYEINSVFRDEGIVRVSPLKS